MFKLDKKTGRKIELVLTEEEEGMTDLPDCFNKDKLTPIDIDKVCFWDETHKKVRFGSAWSTGPCKRKCIRFWRMAGTFTGLKLQGAIGKFGKIELSDICAFAQLPDGKVLTGSENGSLLLWEGNFIKCEIATSSGARPHNGNITALKLDRDAGHFVSGGDDGRLCWWSFKDIDLAEVDDDTPQFVLVRAGGVCG